MVRAQEVGCHLGPGQTQFSLSPKPAKQGEGKKRELGFPTHRLEERKRVLVSAGSGIRVALTFGPENPGVNLNRPGVGVNKRLGSLLRAQDPPTPALPPCETVGLAISRTDGCTPKDTTLF